MFNLFIDDHPIETLKKSIEDIIIKSAGEALGKKYFGVYYDVFGDASGLGKTYEKCLIYRLNEIDGVSSIGDGSSSMFDGIVTHNDQKSLIQIKTSIDVGKTISLARISKGNSTKDKIDIYIEKVRSRMINSNISNFFLLYVSTSDGKMYLYKMAEIENGEFIFHPNKDEYFSHSEKQTPLNFKLEGAKLVRKKKVPGLFTVDVEDEKKPINRLLDFETLQNDLFICSKRFKEIDKGLLGSEWGDKGIAYEKFSIKYLSKKYSNIKMSKKKNSSIDIIFVGLGAVQLKTCSSKKGFDKWIIFGRSSVDIQSDNVDDNIVYINDKSHHRRNDIKNRISDSLIDSGEKTFHLILVDLCKFTSDVKFLSELAEDLSLSCKGSFLMDDHYNSDGGETGNQTHFRIKTVGLVDSIKQDSFGVEY